MSLCFQARDRQLSGGGFGGKSNQYLGMGGGDSYDGGSYGGYGGGGGGGTSPTNSYTTPAIGGPSSLADPYSKPTEISRPATKVKPHFRIGYRMMMDQTDDGISSGMRYADSRL